MANIATLRPKPFTSEYQPATKGRKPGVPNRAKIYERILNMPVDEKMPDGSTLKISMFEAIALGQARAARKGNTKAWQEIQDSFHGKIPASLQVENVSVTPAHTLEAFHDWLKDNGDANEFEIAVAVRQFAELGRCDAEALALEAGVIEVAGVVEDVDES